MYIQISDIQKNKQHIYRQIDVSIAMLRCFQTFSFYRKGRVTVNQVEDSKIIIEAIDTIHYELKYYGIEKLSFVVKQLSEDIEKYQRILAPEYYINELKQAKKELRKVRV